MSLLETNIMVDLAYLLLKIFRGIFMETYRGQIRIHRENYVRAPSLLMRGWCSMLFYCYKHAFAAFEHPFKDL
jgi:hypothetical protein